ncbi:MULTISPECIES: helix-turn-helix domain-containing protein [Gordonibacter]|uniref:Helix-turn-helix transcriptional regulator n=1 Tax=Gordonibacter faecis TaxID=3047475 RepID=A0ABT7DPC2_9ACTN|nr:MULTISPECIES: helix-turn-helix transcriptional regulator [unclassified Gordonibacter]MDJ1651399.1 helix-turn-helix transcriptional regulator [Gordonibacter sp. KGMB12511]HIW75992.1 helix-turn-helix domain-containing protein [Candidatus Gordonibacter avicola]
MLAGMSALSDTSFDSLDASPEQVRALKVAFGATVTARRVDAGIEQSVFALVANMSNNHLREIEAGKGNPTLATMHRIAAAFGTTADDLLSEAYERAFGSSY